MHFDDRQSKKGRWFFTQRKNEINIIVILLRVFNQNLKILTQMPLEQSHKINSKVIYREIEPNRKH
jgi:hypothetical protein